VTADLALIQIHNNAFPAAFHELAAAKYLGMCRSYFRELVKAGLIPFTSHAGRSTRIYLRTDLDAYLLNLEKHTMGGRENPLMALKGAK
jgi:excisionase family DNA binding protein